MPLYEYQCDACGRRFELIRKFSDPPLEVCPTCGGPVHKLMSSPAIQFKGSGFYITDYAKKDQSGQTKSEKAEKAEKSGESNSDTASKDKDSKASDKTDKTDKTETKASGPAGSTTSPATAPSRPVKAD